MSNRILATIQKLFTSHRLVFWYDENAEMKDLFENIDLQDVIKIVVSNDEFALKHRVLIEEPDKKFLLYQPSACPKEKDNWLIDLVLSNYRFQTDISSLQLQELELPQEFKPLLDKHPHFFTDQNRIESLKALITPDESESSLLMKMLSVACKSDSDWDKILYSLFEDALNKNPTLYSTIVDFKLDGFLWDTIRKKFDYKKKNALLKDFLIALFRDDFERSISSGKAQLKKDAFLFMSRWKENIKSGKLFKKWSMILQEDLSIEDSILDIDSEKLLDADTFEVIEKKILIQLRDHVRNETLEFDKLQQWIEKRKNKFYYKEFEYLYNALGSAACLLLEIKKSNLKVESPFEAFTKYRKHWYKIDRLYRDYIFASEKAEHQNLLKELTEKIEKAYGNSYLLKLGDNWQAEVDKMQSWEIEGIDSQSHFYDKWVQPFVDKENRIFVIISDALRYESATELLELILQEDRYTATIEASLGVIPSYTQLGMASLLPHTKLTFDNQNDVVFADGVSTLGTENRSAVLRERHSASIAITAEEFLRMKSHNEGREFVKKYDVIYIYNNTIDKTGDDKISEGQVFAATNQEFDNILKILKHINNMNGYNMIITSDHGYLYQHNKLEDTDFTEFTPSGKIYKSNRRFVLGKQLEYNDSVKKWSGISVGLSDDTEVLTAKSINRVRIQGAGSRFVHGGSSLQEVTIPVLEIYKTRKSDVQKVDIDIISGTTNITSSTFGVSFFQKEPVSEKIQQRQLRIGFYSSSNELISDVVNLKFDVTKVEAVSREKRQTFTFTSEAPKFNGQDVNLRLEEAIEGSSNYKVFKVYKFRMLISFGGEFDEF